MEKWGEARKSYSSVGGERLREAVLHAVVLLGGGAGAFVAAAAGAVGGAAVAFVDGLTDGSLGAVVDAPSDTAKGDLRVFI